MATGWVSLVVVIAASCFFAASLGSVVVGPQNFAAVATTAVNLTCTSSLTGNERIQFMEYITNPSGAMISDGSALLPGHPNYFSYGFSSDLSIGLYTLTIRSTVVSDGGRYACRDINALPFPTYGYSELVIIDGLPNCTNTLPPNRIVNVGDYYTAECTVNYRASPGISPSLSWTGYGNFTQGTIGHNMSTWSGMQFNVERAMDSRAFQCKTNFTSDGFGGEDTATNVPVWQYLYSTGLIFVQYGPTNMRYSPIQASYEVGQVLTCYADAVPLPSYTWTNMVTLVSYYSQSLTLTTDMVGYLVLRCQAVNSVSTGNLFTNITVNPITTPTIPTTTTPPSTLPAWTYCDDLTGRWEAPRDDGATTVLCINVDTSNNGLVRGLWVNTTDDPFFTEIIGRTRNGEYDEIGFSTMWADRIGVSSFAGECHRCHSVEFLMINAVSRSSSDQAFCTDGGTVFNSAQLDFTRVPVSYPCSTTLSVMQENLRQNNAKLPAHRRRRRAVGPMRV